MTIIFTIILFLCSFISSVSLTHAGHGLDSWLFWVEFACYITACACAWVWEYKYYNKTAYEYFSRVKVGDTVYWAWDNEEADEKVIEGRVRGLSVSENGTTWFSVVYYEEGLTFEHTFKDYWGKTVFHTREEAEKALAERSEG